MPHADPTSANAPVELTYATPEPHRPNKPLLAAITCAALFIPTVIINYTTRLNHGLLVLLLPALPFTAIILASAARRTARRHSPHTLRQAHRIQRLVCAEVLFLAACYAFLPVIFPVSLSRSRETANRVKCGSNLRHIGHNLVAYARANQGRYPPSLDLLMTDLTPDPEWPLTWDSFICPSTSNEPTSGPTTRAAAQIFRALHNHCSYIYAAADLRAGAIAPDRILVAEALHNHINAGGNFLFADGHVEFFNQRETAYYLAELQLGHNPPRPRPSPP